MGRTPVSRVMLPPKGSEGRRGPQGAARLLSEVAAIVVGVAALALGTFAVGSPLSPGLIVFGLVALGAPAVTRLALGASPVLAEPPVLPDEGPGGELGILREAYATDRIDLASLEGGIERVLSGGTALVNRPWLLRTAKPLPAPPRFQVKPVDYHAPVYSSAVYYGSSYATSTSSSSTGQGFVAPKKIWQWDGSAWAYVGEGRPDPPSDPSHRSTC